MVNKLVEKHVREHIERRFSAGHSESEKVILMLKIEITVAVNSKIF